MLMQKFALPRKIIHWFSTMLFVAVVFVGFNMEDMGSQALTAHLVLGLTLFAMTVARLFLAKKFPRPPYPAAISRFNIRVAKTVQSLMVVLLLLQPMLGLVIYNAPQTLVTETKYKNGGREKFEKQEMEYTSDIDEALAELHETTAWILVLLIGMHAAGVAKHMLVNRQNLLSRMT
jgi:cytochrome b561